MPAYFYIVLIPALPLASFVILGLAGKNRFKVSAGIIGCISLFISAILSLYTAYQYFFVDGKVNGVYEKTVALKHTWLQFSPNISIDMGILIDPISVMMLVIVSFVSLMVHLFSLRY